MHKRMHTCACTHAYVHTYTHARTHAHKVVYQVTKEDLSSFDEIKAAVQEELQGNKTQGNTATTKASKRKRNAVGTSDTCAPMPSGLVERTSRTGRVYKALNIPELFQG